MHFAAADCAQNTVRKQRLGRENNYGLEMISGNVHCLSGGFADRYVNMSMSAGVGSSLLVTAFDRIFSVATWYRRIRR